MARKFNGDPAKIQKWLKIKENWRNESFDNFYFGNELPAWNVKTS